MKYFLTLNKNENPNQNKDNITPINIQRRVKSHIHNGNHNIEIIDENKKDKINNALPKEKRNINTKQNSKDFNTKIHKKIYNNN